MFILYGNTVALLNKGKNDFARERVAMATLRKLGRSRCSKGLASGRVLIGFTLASMLTSPRTATVTSAAYHRRTNAAFAGAASCGCALH